MSTEAAAFRHVLWSKSTRLLADGCSGQSLPEIFTESLRMPARSSNLTAWLATNRRLAGLLTAGVVLLVVLTGAAAVFARLATGGWAVGAWIAAVGVALSLPLGAIATAAWTPPLLQSGEQLLVRLGPGRRESLPLAAVEAFFLGSQPLDRRGEPTCPGEAAFRVGTLVVRVAERATDLNRRTTRGPWAAWEDGYLIIDGRWTEPLTTETVRRVNGRLTVAKRAEPPAGQVDAATSAGCCP